MFYGSVHKCIVFSLKHVIHVHAMGINVKYTGFKLSFANISMVNIKLRKNTSPMGAVDT